VSEPTRSGADSLNAARQLGEGEGTYSRRTRGTCSLGGMRGLAERRRKKVTALSYPEETSLVLTDPATSKFSAPVQWSLSP
jgi:hypothetical protein